MSRQAANDAARDVLRVPLALTRTVRAPESGFRRMRTGESEGRRTTDRLRRAPLGMLGTLGHEDPAHVPREHPAEHEEPDSQT